MKKLRLLAAFTAVILCLQSCGIIIINDINGSGGESSADDGTDRVTETQKVKEIIIDKQTFEEMKKNADDALEKVETLEYSGMRILVAATDTVFYEGIEYEDEDDPRLELTSDRVRRHEMIHNKLNANVSLVRYTEKELYEKLSAAVKKKEYFADVIAVPQRLVGTLAAEGLIKSLRTVPGLDLNADYFYPDALSAFSGGHSSYAVTGDGCFEPEKLYCVYFNKDMAKQLGYDMHALVASGEWTLEKYAECVMKAASEGYGTAVTRSPELYKKMLLTGSGFDFTESGVDKTPAANTFTEEYENKVRLLASIPASTLSSSPLDDFLSGKALFFIDTAFTAESMADSELVWGMLPFPKYDADHEYGSYISDTAIVLCVPEYAAFDRLSGDFIKALNASSEQYIKYDYLYHGIYDVLRDNGSVNSLNFVINNPNYDFVTAMKSGYPTLYANTSGAFDELMKGSLTFEEYKEREAEVAEYTEKWFPVKYK